MKFSEDEKPSSIGLPWAAVSNGTADDASFSKATKELLRVGTTECDLIAEGPIEVVASGCAYLVLEGFVDIYIEGPAAAESRELNTRLYLTRRHGGDLVCVKHSTRMVAIAGKSTRLARVPWPHRSTLTPRQLQAWTLLLERWIVALQNASRIPAQSANICTIPETDKYIPIIGGAVRTSGCIRWVSADDGSVALFGANQVDLRAQAPVPIKAELWATCSAGGSTISTAELIQQGSLTRGLDSFHLSLQDVLNPQLDDGTDSEVLRNHAKAQEEDVALGILRRPVAGMFAKGIASHCVSRLAHVDSLSSACNLVARKLGAARCDSEPIAAPNFVEGEFIAGRLAANGIRTRRVHLSGAWWRHDCGLMLAFRADNHEPVVLAPRKLSGYSLTNHHGKTVKLTEPLARQLEVDAYCAFRPLPRGPLGLGEVLRFSLKGQLATLAFAALAGVCASILGLSLPLFATQIIARTIPAGATAELVQFALLFSCASVAVALFTAAQGVCIQRLRASSNSALEIATWDRLVRLPAEFFLHSSVGDIASRALATSTLSTTVISTAIAGAFGATSFLLSLIAMLYFSPTLTAYSLGACSVLILTNVLFLKSRLRLQQSLVALKGEQSARVFQILSAIVKIRSAQAEKRMFGVWAREFAKQTAKYVTFRGYANGLAAFNTVYGSTIVLLLFAAIAFGNHALDVAMVIGFMIAFQQFHLSTIGLMGSLAGALSAISVFERTRVIWRAIPENDIPKKAPERLSGRIEVSGLTYRYPAASAPAVCNVSFSVQRGEYLAICGSSGSGKSTLVRLLLGLSGPTSGTVAYDGDSLAHLNACEVREQIGAVMQNSQLVPGTLLQNIAGIESASSEKAWEAACLVGLSEMIAALPMRMQTIVAAGGITFSAGQRQQIQIAKALIKKPRILIFDESTSSLDNNSQALINRNLARLAVTRIVVAHRLSTIRQADRILVLEKGQLVQVGTYEELAAQPGVFAELVKRQCFSG